MFRNTVKKAYLKAAALIAAVTMLAAPAPALADSFGFAQAGELTREEFCAVLAQTLYGEATAGAAALPFADAGDINDAYLPYIQLLYANGILKGMLDDGDVYMRPNSAITMQDAVSLTGRALLTETETAAAALRRDNDLNAAEYAYPYAAWFVQKGIVAITDVNAAVTRDEASLMITKTVNEAQRGAVLVKTHTGMGGRGDSDGSYNKTSFYMPRGVITENSGVLIVFDTYNNLIRRVSQGSSSTVTGVSSLVNDAYGFPQGGYVDGELSKALLSRPADGVFNAAGELIFADSGNSVIRIIRNGRTYTVSGGAEGYADGVKDKARFNAPLAVAADNNGNIYVADTGNNCIRKIDTNFNVTTIAGAAGVEGFRDGAAADALFSSPAGIAVSGDGSVIYVSDTGNHRIRKIENGYVTTIAGSTSGADADGSPLGGYADGADALFNLPTGITLAEGVIIVADSANHCIRAITGDGITYTAAGTGEAGDTDGTAKQAEFHSPMGVHYSDGVLYIADTYNNKIKTMPFDIELYK